MSKHKQQLKKTQELFSISTTELVKALEVAVEALKFYSDKDNWDDDPYSPTIWEDGRIDLGKKATKALAEIEKILGVKGLT